MTGQWEKYAEQAAAVLARVIHDRQDRMIDGHIEDDAAALAEAVLATVGPLIAEDTRERMVAAAGAALERDDGRIEWEVAPTPCAVCAAAKVPVETAREYFFNGDEADEVWVDKP